MIIGAAYPAVMSGEGKLSLVGFRKLSEIRYYLEKDSIIFSDVSEPWSDERQSQYIEGILMYFPLHQITVMDRKTPGNPAERLEILDGNNRLRAIRRWFMNDLALTGLTLNPDLNGYRFSQLKDKFDRDTEGYRAVPVCEFQFTGNRDVDLEKLKTEISRRLNMRG